MDKKDKYETVSKIKDHIHNDKNGYCGVVWACKEVMGKDFQPKKWQIKSIASIITEDGKYIKEKAELKTYYDFDISLNPNSNWFDRNPIKTEIIRFILTVSAAVIISHLT